jgi:hypothetical protein
VEIRDHQDLLKKFYNADETVIWNCSTNIQDDLEELYDACSEYAIRNGLMWPPIGVKR